MGAQIDAMRHAYLISLYALNSIAIQQQHYSCVAIVLVLIHRKLARNAVLIADITFNVIKWNMGFLNLSICTTCLVSLLLRCLILTCWHLSNVACSWTISTCKKKEQNRSVHRMNLLIYFSLVYPLSSTKIHMPYMRSGMTWSLKDIVNSWRCCGGKSLFIVDCRDFNSPSTYHLIFP